MLTKKKSSWLRDSESVFQGVDIKLGKLPARSSWPGRDFYKTILRVNTIDLMQRSTGSVYLDGVFEISNEARKSG